MAVQPELVERFRADLAELWSMEGAEPLGIAFSGGPDSLALLLLANASRAGRVEAATVDHGLRAESGKEASVAGSICAKLGIPHETLRVTVSPGNVQTQARNARYAALADWAERRGIKAVATAHHADDQAETFLMRANRGSGLSGLAGIRNLTALPNSLIPLCRPLLGWRRAELADIVRQSGFEPVCDPSNDDDRFDRVRVRKALAGSNLIDVVGLARSAAHLARMEDAVDALILEDLDHAGSPGNPFGYRPFRHSAIHRPPIWVEIVVVICRDLGAELTRKEASRMVATLLDQRTVNIAGIQARTREEANETVWLFQPENPRRPG